MFVNDEWFDTFTNCIAEFLPEGISDHCSCLIRPVSSVVSKPKSFRLYNRWMDDLDFMTKVQEAWGVNVDGVAMFKVVNKLKKLNLVLKALNKEKLFSDIKNESVAAMVKLFEIQKRIHQDPRNSELHKNEEEAIKNYEFLNKAKMSFFATKGEE